MSVSIVLYEVVLQIYTKKKKKLTTKKCQELCPNVTKTVIIINQSIRT